MGIKIKNVSKEIPTLFPSEEIFAFSGASQLHWKGGVWPNQCQRSDESTPALKDALKDYDIGKEGKKFWLEKGHKEEEKKPRLHYFRNWAIACISSDLTWCLGMGSAFGPMEVLVSKLNVEGILSFLIA